MRSCHSCFKRAFLCVHVFARDMHHASTLPSAELQGLYTGPMGLTPWLHAKPAILRQRYWEKNPQPIDRCRPGVRGDGRAVWWWKGPCRLEGACACASACMSATSPTASYDVGLPRYRACRIDFYTSLLTNGSENRYSWLENAEIDQLNRYVRLKRIAAAQKYGLTAPPGRGPGPASAPLPGAGNASQEPPAEALQLLQASPNAGQNRQNGSIILIVSPKRSD